ncbi:uncharacterized protein TNCV_3333221 [Trichonephila clavipes]|nr:uncharacterized protein TNCV_3333221 [Trichonephila clavipes]
MVHVILNHGQVTWTTPELASPLLTTTPHQREEVSALDRFNVHRCPTRWVFNGIVVVLRLMPPNRQRPDQGHEFHHGQGLSAHAAKALYIYKPPCLLQDSSPVPTAPQSASPTTIPVWRQSIVVLKECGTNPLNSLILLTFCN